MLYDLVTWGFVALVNVAASFNKKARLLVQGRKQLQQQVEKVLTGNQDKIIWVHCASLGEFEQGRPIIESIKKKPDGYKIMLTFFSPSGYEVRKNYAEADYIFYLPYDFQSDCCKFIATTKPIMAIIIKYEFWPNLFRELHKSGIPIISASSIFRNDQAFFKFYGSSQRKTLSLVNHFFVQNAKSVELLKSIGLTNTTIAGDTRFDRVFKITQSNKENEIAKRFRNDQTCWVVGSCWPEDFKILSQFINEDAGQSKFIIAPHEIEDHFIESMRQSLLVKTARYSETNADFENCSVLFIDNIGMLSMLYRYGNFAYVGGGLGKGLHNILEAACYGIPVFYGNKNYKKFQEAVDLINHGGGFAVGDFISLKESYETLMNPEDYQIACNASRNYVEMNLGATDKVVNYCMNLLKE